MTISKRFFGFELNKVREYGPRKYDRSLQIYQEYLEFQIINTVFSDLGHYQVSKSEKSEL